MAIEDALFYWSHRALHTPWLYKRIHKVSCRRLGRACVVLVHQATSLCTLRATQIHHEYYVNAALGSEHAHPVEFIFGNLVPLAM